MRLDPPPILSSLLLVCLPSLTLSIPPVRSSIVCTPTLSTVSHFLSIWKSSLVSGSSSSTPVCNWNWLSSLPSLPISPLLPLPTIMRPSARPLSNGTFPNYGESPLSLELSSPSVPGSPLQPLSSLAAVSSKTLVNVMKFSSSKSPLPRTGSSSSLVPMDLSGAPSPLGNSPVPSPLSISSPPCSVCSSVDRQVSSLSSVFISSPSVFSASWPVSTTFSKIPLVSTA